jgi:hypothetical protein
MSTDTEERKVRLIFDTNPNVVIVFFLGAWTLSTCTLDKIDRMQEDQREHERQMQQSRLEHEKWNQPERM